MASPPHQVFVVITVPLEQVASPLWQVVQLLVALSLQHVQQEQILPLVPSVKLEPAEKPTMLAHMGPVVQLKLLLQLESFSQLKQIVQVESAG